MTVVMDEIKHTIEVAWNDREKLKEQDTKEKIEYVIEELDKGRLRVAEESSGQWQVHEWVKKAVILYFPLRKMETTRAGILEFHDKM